MSKSEDRPVSTLRKLQKSCSLKNLRIRLEVFSFDGLLPPFILLSSSAPNPLEFLLNDCKRFKTAKTHVNFSQQIHFQPIQKSSLSSPKAYLYPAPKGNQYR